MSDFVPLSADVLKELLLDEFGCSISGTPSADFLAYIIRKEPGGEEVLKRVASAINSPPEETKEAENNNDNADDNDNDNDDDDDDDEDEDEDTEDDSSAPKLDDEVKQKALAEARHLAAVAAARANPRGSTRDSHTKRGLSVLDVRRNAHVNDALKVLATEAQLFLEEVLEGAMEVTHGDFDGLLSALASGVVLCQVALTGLSPLENSQTVNFHPEATPRTEQAATNIKHFLDAAVDIGLPAGAVFTPDHINGTPLTPRNPKLVFNVLLRVAALVHKKTAERDIGSSSPPSSPKTGKGIFSRLRRRSSAGLLTESSTATGSTMARHAHDILTTPSTEHDDAAHPPIPDQKDDDHEHGNEEEDETWVVDPRLAIMTEDDVHNALEKAEYLPYTAKEGDHLDESIAECLNSHVLDLRVAKVVPTTGRTNKHKKKHKGHRNEGVERGEYMVGTHSRQMLNFRVVRDVLFVLNRANDHWEGALEYLENRLKIERDLVQRAERRAKKAAKKSRKSRH